jgi:hypothetical protein
MEFDERKRLNPWSQFQIFTNAHLHNRIKPWLDLAVGVSYVLTKVAESVTVNEWRPWQEVSVYKKIGKDLLFQFRYRLDERFINRNDGETLLTSNQYAWRNRFRIQFSKPIIEFGNHKTITFKLADEVMINMGNARTFDQNQLTTSLEWKLTDHLSFENSYVNYFQPISDYVFRDRHIIRTTLYHRIDVRKRT